MSRVAHADTPKPFETRAQTPTVIHDPPGTMPVHGPRFAAVTAEFFCDPHNYTSKRVYQRLMELAKRHPTRLRIVYHVYSARYAPFLAEAMAEAGAQGRFHEFAKLLLLRGSYTKQKHIPDLARAAGVDFSGIERAWKDKRHLAALRAVVAARTRRGFTIARRRVVFNGIEFSTRSSYPNIDQYENAYDEAYARGKALMAQGIPLAALHARLLRDIDDARPLTVLRRGTVDGPSPRTRRETEPRPTLVRGRVSYTGPHTRGPENARVPIVLFCSLQSSLCGRLARLLETVRTKYYAKRVRVVFHHLFDDNDPGQPSARLAHEAAMCAHDQQGFWRFVDATFAHLARRSNALPLSIAELRNRAKGAGLDVSKFIVCLESGKNAKLVDKAVAASRAAGVTRTPSLIIGGRLYEGHRTQRDLLYLIREQLRTGLLERWAPSPDSVRQGTF